MTKSIGRAAAKLFASDWVRSWNARDLDTILGHYTDDVTFTSPMAAKVVGRTTLHGRRELEHYLRNALAPVETLRFTLDHFTWDSRARRMTIAYVADLDGERLRVCETMAFHDDGRIFTAEAFYGTPS
ncbi:MAG TPA: nuclear transport factor 2 family protein [Thermoanaerobaculia bacterium]